MPNYQRLNELGWRVELAFEAFRDAMTEETTIEADDAIFARFYDTNQAIFNMRSAVWDAEDVQDEGE